MGARQGDQIVLGRGRSRILTGFTRVLGIVLVAMVAQSAQAIEIKLASVAPDGSEWMRGMRAGAQEIRARTGDRVIIKFYPGGVMGNDGQVLRKIRVGQLHGGAFASGGLAARYAAVNLYSIPLLFRNLQEVDYVRDRMDPRLQAGLAEAGFVTFGFVEGGFAQMMANEPIRVIEDMRRQKVWIPEGDQVSFLAMEALGLSPVVLPPTDVLTGLQTGLLDVVAASPVVALVLQWHTKVKYVTDLPVAYSMGIFAIDARVFARLSDADQQIVREVMTAVIDDLDDRTRTDNRRAREVMQEIGLEFVPVSQSDVEDWRRTIAGIYPELRNHDDIDAELFDDLLDSLREYRSSPFSAAGD